MIRCQVRVVNERGLHVRPAARFVALASEFEASVSVRNGERTSDGKSILGMMTLAARHEALLEISIEGKDESRMADCLGQVLSTDLEIVSREDLPEPPCR